MMLEQRLHFFGYIHFVVIFMVMPCVSCGVDSVTLRPTASAGFDQRVAIGSDVTLDGSESYSPNGQPLGFVWTMLEAPVNSTSPLRAASTDRPSFKAIESGRYVFSLVVTEQGLESTPDIVAIDVTHLNPIASAKCALSNDGVTIAPPCVANTDPCVVSHGRRAQLDGRDSSDPNDNTKQNLTYQWTQLRTQAQCNARCTDIATCTPSNTQVTITSSTTELATFTAPSVSAAAVGSMLVFELVLGDGFTTDSACITFTTSNTAPTLVSPSGTSSPSQITLSTNACDNDGDDLTYNWQQTSGTPVITLVDPTLNFTKSQSPVPAGNYTFTVTVDDGVAATTSGDISITVQ